MKVINDRIDILKSKSLNDTKISPALSSIVRELQHQLISV